MNFSSYGEFASNLYNIGLSRERKFTNLKKHVFSEVIVREALSRIRSWCITSKSVEELDFLCSLSSSNLISSIESILTNKSHGYVPKPVEYVYRENFFGRVEKKTLYSVYDLLVQEILLLIIEPICEARFSDHSHGSRVKRHLENTIADVYFRLQRCNNYYVSVFSLEKYSSEVNHSKIKKQLYTLGIQDRFILAIVGKILRTSRKTKDGVEHPRCGIETTGILKNLFFNICLNEMDRWIESNWVSNPVVEKYVPYANKNGHTNNGNAYKEMRKNNLKEFYFVRYNGEVCIFSKSFEHISRASHAVSRWLKKRLSIDYAYDNFKIVDARRKSFELLDYRIKLKSKSNKVVIVSHVSDSVMEREHILLRNQIRKIGRPSNKSGERKEIVIFNYMVKLFHRCFSGLLQIGVQAEGLYHE